VGEMRWRNIFLKPPRYQSRLAHPRNAMERLRKACAQGAVMKRVLFWGTIVAGAVAAYMMYRRGESMGTIAVRAVTNPVGSLVSELQDAAG
jgi:hypothetical protein